MIAMRNGPAPGAKGEQDPAIWLAVTDLRGDRREIERLKERLKEVIAAELAGRGGPTDGKVDAGVVVTWRLRERLPLQACPTIARPPAI